MQNEDGEKEGGGHDLDVIVDYNENRIDDKHLNLCLAILHKFT